jgi:hypothetical protein
MAFNVRVIPTQACATVVNCFGRSYTPTLNTPQDVVDADAERLVANGWLKVGTVGPSTSRPGSNPTQVGMYAAQRDSHHFDTTLNTLVIFDGYVWRNPATGAVA